MLVVSISLYLSEDDKYKLIETWSMSGTFSGPPSLSQERIHGVTANLPRMYLHHENRQRLYTQYIS